MRILAICLAAVVIAWAAWAQLDPWRGDQAFRIVARYPHDAGAFTQGLAFFAGQLYEGTGQYGASSLRRVAIDTGRVEQMVTLNQRFFGEGITLLDGRIYQLTWRSRTGIVYDAASFEVIDTFRYDGEGWGLTNDGQSLILSDGTATLRFIDPNGFQVQRRLVVRDGDRPVSQLNELEYIDAEIWANVWHDDRIARISPQDGQVLAWLDLGAIYPRSERGPEQVLNGIAYDEASDRIFVTGKNWPELFEIQVRGR